MSVYKRLFIIAWFISLALPWNLATAALSSPSIAEKPIVVIIPSYNNQKWYQKNLDSVFSQNYQNYRVIFIDDASPDGTGQLAKSYVEQKGQEKRVTLIQNPTRMRALANHYQAVWLCDPKEIVAVLDGDDWFIDENVLSRLNSIYRDPAVWMTYGQYVYYPSNSAGEASEVPSHIIEANAFRDYWFVTSHLRSYYAGLFQKIKREDLMMGGEFFPMTGDLATMFPMLEMAGKHSRFVSDVLYAYNMDTGINDFHLDHPLQRRIEGQIRRKERYSPLPQLFANPQVNEPSRDLKKVYILTGCWGPMFAVDDPVTNRDGCLDYMYRLKQIAAEKGYELEQLFSLDDLGPCEYLLVFDLFPDRLINLDRVPIENRILFLWEPPSTVPNNERFDLYDSFSKIYTWNDGLVDNKRFFKFYYPVMRPMLDSFVDFRSKKLCNLISTNRYSYHPNELYSERQKMIRFFETFASHEFDLYGKFWSSDSYPSYRGDIVRKSDYMAWYKFSLTFENIKGIPGYVTEKIFDAFHSGSVPIYWGASNIETYIPKNCFVAREDFENETALYRYLDNMSAKEHARYLDNIRAFLASEQAQLYSPDNFIRIFMDLITTEPGN